jgi:hypothetical protein
LSSLITQGYSEKLVLVPGYADVAAEIKKLPLPSLKTKNLFMTEKIPEPNTQRPPVLASNSPNITPSPLSSPTKPPANSQARPDGVLEGMNTSSPRSSPISYKLAVVRAEHVAESSPSGDARSVSEDSEDGFSLVVSPKRAAVPGQKMRRIDPNLPLSKHNPPPCNLFYLFECKNGKTCRYGHDYQLGQGDMELLRQNAVSMP